MAVVIRAMYSFDVPDVFDVESISHPLPWSRKQLFYDCLSVGYYGAVAEVDGKIIGYGLCSIEKGECHILNLAVVPAERRHHYGRQLVEHLIEVAKVRSANKIVLEVRASNIPAIKLYQLLGFQQTEVRKDYYQLGEGHEDAIAMALQL